MLLSRIGSITVICAIVGCKQAAPPGNDAELQRQVEVYDRQTKRIDDSLDVQQAQTKRFERLLDKWDEQARRQDAILDAQEKREGISKPAAK